MSIIYALVGNGEIILSEYTSHTGNFQMIAHQLLKKTSSN
jgi:membrane protein required for beta-lactamase induction